MKNQLVIATAILIAIFGFLQSTKSTSVVEAGALSQTIQDQSLSARELVRKGYVFAATPHPPDIDERSDGDHDSVTLDGSLDTAAMLSALPDLNSSLDVPSLPGAQQVVTSAVDSNLDFPPCYGMFPNCWNSRVLKYPSQCYLDTNKNQLLINLQFPVYQWEIWGYTGTASIWHQIWRWNHSTKSWQIFSPWSGPITQQASITQGIGADVSFVFRDSFFKFNPSIGGVGGWNNLVATGTLPYSGAYSYVIERYVSLSRVNQSNIIDRDYVRFQNGGVYCGYAYSSSASSLNSSSNDPQIFEAASIPPIDGQPPRFLYLPLINAPAGSAGLPTATPFPTPTLYIPPTPSSPSTTGNMQNANFDLGSGVGWTEYSKNNYKVIMNGPKGYTARSGQYLAWLGGAHDEVTSISQEVTIPATHPFLTFYLIASSQENYCHYDLASIWIDDYKVGSFGLCKQHNSYSWLKHQVDLRDFAGETVTFSIKMETDDSLLSHMFIDDLTFDSGVLIPTPVPSPTPFPGGGAFRNPGFELGNNGDWTSYTSSGYGNIFSNSGSHSGNWLSWLGGTDNETGYIEQTVTIPADRPYMVYWGWISSAESTCSGDQVQFLAGSSLLYSYYLCSPYNSTQWGQGWVNLSAYAGTTQKIRIQVQTNGAATSSLYLDDFTFASSPPANIVSAPGAQPAGVAGENDGWNDTGLSPLSPGDNQEFKEPKR